MTPLSDPTQLCRPLLTYLALWRVLTGCWKKKQNIRFLVWCAGVTVCGLLLKVNVRLLLVCGCLLVVWGHMWSLVGSLLSFVVAACLSNYGQRTLHSKQVRYLMFKQLQRDFKSQSPISWMKTQPIPLQSLKI